VWPLYALFVLLPLWWALGISAFIWPLMAVPMLFGLLIGQRDVRWPRGFGLWMLFLGWMLLSGTRVTDVDRLTSFLYRGSLYAAATVLFLYVFNLPSSSVPARTIVRALSVCWLMVVAGGYLALVLPGVEFRSLAERVLPGLANHSLAAVVHPRFAQVSRVLGYQVGRPTAPFAYPNAWGANFALLTPFVVMSWRLDRSKSWLLLTRGGMAASVVPLVMSLDRGAWLSLSLAVLYAAGWLALKGRARPLMGGLALIVAAAALFALPPIRKVIEDRLAHGHSDAGRASLYTEATQRALDSPILGYGAPVASVTQPLKGSGITRPDVGTHGQLWLVLVSHGIPGMLAFVGWYLLLLVNTRRGQGDVPFWCHVVILLSFLQLPFYEQLPSQLQIVMVAGALALREMRPSASPLAVPGSVRPASVPG
jgi:hypothetical protein